MQEKSWYWKAYIERNGQLYVVVYQASSAQFALSLAELDWGKDNVDCVKPMTMEIYVNAQAA